MEYDVFISHASEDKKSFVEPLANALIQAGLRVWYDRFELKLGDSLREKIDEGLANCGYGIVVLSKAFFAKKWTRAELDALVTRQNREGKKVILPVWHEVDEDEVGKFSPMLAGRVAARSSDRLDAIVSQVLTICNEGYQPQHMPVPPAGSRSGLRAKCREIIKAADMLEWRALVDELTEPAPRELKKWKAEKGEGAAHKGGDDWRHAFLEAVDICIPGFVPIIASIEVGRPDFWEESLRFVRRLATLSGEMGGGATATIYIGDSLLHIIGSLGMAMAVKTRQIEVVDRWMGMPIQDREIGKEIPWLKKRRVHFLPKGIGRDPSKPFALLSEIRKREPMAGFFPDDVRFTECMFLSNLLGSLVEFRQLALNPNDLRALLEAPQYVALDVPALWMMMPHEKFQPLTCDLFGTSRRVFEYTLPGQSVDPKQFWLMWKQWKIVCLNAMNSYGRASPLLLDWMRLPGEPLSE